MTTIRSSFLMIALIVLGRPIGASAQVAPGSVQLDVGAAKLSDGFDDWWSVRFSADAPLGERDRVRGEILRAGRFGSAGTYLSVGGRHDFDARWALEGSVAHAPTGFFFPRSRAETSLALTLPPLDLVARAGVGWIDYPDAHRSRDLILSGAWYGVPGWVAQADARFTRSDPGRVGSGQYAVAVTRLGEESLLVARVGWGREAYQALTPDRAAVDFAFRELAVEGRRDLTGPWGALLRLEGYDAPHYRRAGVSAGIFRRWP